MAFLVYNKIKTYIMQGQLDFREAGDDLRIMLVMTNTTCDTEDDIQFLDGFTTEDEYTDGASYPPSFANRNTLDTQAVNEQLSDDRVEFDAVDEVISSIAASSSGRLNQGIVIYKQITNDAASLPIVFITAGFAGNGGNVTLQFNSEGILQLA